MLTVFIATFNRLDTLERTVKSYAKQDIPSRIVIVDNGTDWQPAVDLLERLEPKVEKIYRLPAVMSMQELTDNYNVAVADQYQTSKSRWFAITDADVCFDGTKTDALWKYILLSRLTGNAVGPHLRVNDIPPNYPLRSRVLSTESRLLYRHSMDVVERVPCSFWPIDTTFHVFPRTEEFRRLKMDTLRCGPPYDAMHLDWYVDFLNPTEENSIYIGQSPSGGIGSWGGSWIKGFWRWFQRNPEAAYQMMVQRYQSVSDLCNTSFLISWCLQYGHGVEQNTSESIRWLDAAIPVGTPWKEHRDDWMEMIYASDFSSLGWDDDIGDE